MLMKFLFYFCTIIYFFVCFSYVIINVVYYLQLDGYKERSIFVSLRDCFKSNYLIVFLYFIILFLIDGFSDYTYFLLLLIMSLIVSVMVLLGSRFNHLKDIKYTKRMIRLLVVNYVVFLLIAIILLSLFKAWFVTMFFPILGVIAYLNVYLSLLILKPIENKINNHYVAIATNKIKNSNNLTKIAITGSFGKTSTKEILNKILLEEYSVCATEKSYNTPMGISITINNKLKSVNEIFLCEMGAKKKGEIKELCDIVSPDIGVVVSVGRQHMETFKDIDSVYKTKKELPDCLINKTCVFNLDNYYVRKMYDNFSGNKIGVFIVTKRSINLKLKLKKKCKSFKLKPYHTHKYDFYNKSNCFYAKNIHTNENGLIFDVFYKGMFLFNCKSYLLGIHNITNILLAIAVAKYLKVPVEKIDSGIGSVENINARMQKFEYPGGAMVINNGYNSNLDSAKFTLSALNLFNRKFKYVITPGLVECLNAYEDNVAFAKILARYATNVIIVGKLNYNSIYDGLLECGFAKENIEFVEKFDDCKKLLNESSSNYVFLIENDLPENYR